MGRGDNRKSLKMRRKKSQLKKKARSKRRAAVAKDSRKKG